MSQKRNLQPQLHQPCIHCNEPTTITHRQSLASGLRLTKNIKQSMTVREGLETIVAKIYKFEGIPIEEGRFVCRPCCGKITTLCSAYLDLMTKSNPDSYVQSLVAQAAELNKPKKERKNKSKKPPKVPKPPVLVRVIRTPPIPIGENLKKQYKTPGGSQVITNFVLRQIRTEVFSLMKKCKVFRDKEEKKDATGAGPEAEPVKDILDPHTFDTFWDEVRQALETHAPLIYKILKGIGIRNRRRPIIPDHPTINVPEEPKVTITKPPKMDPAIGTALCILLRSRNQKCCNFQYHVGLLLYRVIAEGEKQKTFDLFWRLKLCSCWSTITNRIKKFADAEENGDDMEMESEEEEEELQEKMPRKKKKLEK